MAAIMPSGRRIKRKKTRQRIHFFTPSYRIFLILIIKNKLEPVTSGRMCRHNNRRKTTHWVTLAVTTIGGTRVHTVADQGAVANLITKKMADQLRLHIKTESPPKLKSLWNQEPYTTVMRTDAKVMVAGCPGRWMGLVVVDFKTDWELLMGSKTTVYRLLHQELSCEKKIGTY
ncbi:hypothetical protein BDF14DRAFT_1178531 [Spinellus fusiger]|nr:hypothetical protein BDF14DRAFT_1178531 [Spinellus fusiger]